MPLSTPPNVPGPSPAALGGAASPGAIPPHSSNEQVLAITQSADVLNESQELTVSVEMANAANVSDMHFTFCEIAPIAQCFLPTSMAAASGSNWFVGTTDSMQDYGLGPGARVGYNITINMTGVGFEWEPTTPNPFTNLTTSVIPITGEAVFEIFVNDSVALQDYRLSGEVRDNTTGAAIAGAQLTLAPGNISTASSALGAFAFADVVNGSYSLSVEEAGYFPYSSNLTISGANLSLTVGLTNATPGSSGSGSPPANLAPTFTLRTIYGENFSLQSFRGHDVVLMEFTSLSCSECQVVEKTLSSLYSGYNGTGHADVVFLSIFVEPQYGDSIPALQSYQRSHNVTWAMAQDTDSLAVYHAYGVSDIPTVVIINEKGQAVYEQSGAQSQATLQSTVSAALAGTAGVISIVSVSVFALAAIAGVTTFFSPCAFPMFPGYMTLFLGLNTNSAQAAPPAGGAYKGAARRALSAGSITALGMIAVFLLVGLALVLAASVVAGYIPDLLVVVGVALIGLGALLLTNLQYWGIVAPLQRLWGRITGKSGTAPVVGDTPATGGAFYLKLFSYGLGYGAASAGCVFPVIFSAIIAGLALGTFGGILTILIYSVTAALLMIVVTLIIAVAGQRYVNQLKAYTPIIKKVSAAALLIVGVYLIYFYYTAWVV
ncbi:MAG: carboxypeptidase regulatory-like domain-containing protein [Thermoplasmata archaeon]|nr:carboxypeptidase regulatory-like domain-containing protein [Thermoplasmata archaeon]